MTVTKPQAQMIATLACDARPIGARQWNPDDVMAEIAKLADRSLGAVILAVTRAAIDRGAERPSVITSLGTHWRDTRVAETFVPQVLNSSERCTICGKSEPSCRVTTDTSDHEFKSAAMAAKEAADVDAAAKVAALKAELEPTAGPTERRTLEDLAAANPKLHANLEMVRQMIPDPQMRETEAPDKEAQ